MVFPVLLKFNMSKGKSILLRIFLIIGILIFFYPNISDYVNSFTQTRGIVSYNKALNEFDKVEIDKILENARKYNEKIFEEKNSIFDPYLVKGYKENLNPFNDGMMGSIIIEKLNINLPIYHGVNEGVIQSCVGHLPGTSLPIGGSSTHAVLSTHNGLSSARLFTDLHKLEIGDEFILSILGNNLYYKVDQIETVLPKDVDLLKVYEGKDYVTLFTCTPYGINTHRLLVRGERIEKTLEPSKEEVEKKTKNNFYLNILKFTVIFLLILIIFITVVKDLINVIRRKRRD